MSRQSQVELATLKPNLAHERLRPRQDAPDEVKQIFAEIVSAVKAEHFRPEDGALIEQYAQSIAIARQAYAELETNGPVIDGKQSPWVVVLEKAHRSSVALCARLRLSPQHRSDPKTAGRKGHPASIYEEMP